ncbi:MAG TPA: FAD-binding and (Fe-S)-binding domain-containing protein, partial [Bacteroidota bacterium]|nr:FAD-binding and (Fe-S)-binding domain-containing protein [Bacteroidota bacterium]
FRAAGTSLSGQSVSDSVLVVLSGGWRRYQIHGDASRISLEPGVVGAHANAYLAPYGRKIGPDPASINAAMIGGIAANNASGMCCGTAQNSYRTLSSMRVILGDGSRLDTADQASVASFRSSHAELLEKIAGLGLRARADAPLAARIREKYRMKNTTGYSLNALVDFEDPVDILQHLLIGSEGTLAFIAEITYDTVPELPCKASALALFPDIGAACHAVPLLKACSVDAVELMDRASLRSVEGKEGMPEYLPGLPAGVAALLVETRAAGAGALGAAIGQITDALAALPLVRPLAFTDVPAEYERLWNIRKGLFPSVGAMRRTGTTVIIEDVAFPVERLAEAALDLRRLLDRHGYGDAILFGHALEGNLHFVFTQDFNAAAQVNRYASMIDDVTAMVVKKYDGSLKAEHGTGRNMAPFVEREWGTAAYGLMKEIKAIFDPAGLINPGVVINPDPQAHLKHLKPLPAADPVVDTCIECGFCEVHCPSKDLSLTPRQRIAATREMSRLRASGADGARLDALSRAFRYAGEETCATDGLCATACPVGIDTGKLIKEMRHREGTRISRFTAGFLARRMALATGGMRVTLNTVAAAHAALGTGVMTGAARAVRRLSGNRIPLWNPCMPGGAGKIPRPSVRNHDAPCVVYFPSCINRSMGPSPDYGDEPGVMAKTVSLLEKGGYRVIFPGGLSDLCCGMAFDSKGFHEAGALKAEELNRALLAATENGTHPVYADMSPCLYRMKQTLDGRLSLYEPVEFILRFLAGRLEFRKIPDTVAVHATCSAIKMGLAPRLKALAELCAERVVVPSHVECCGWAGDRGFTFPELNASALSSLKEDLPRGCNQGYSTSRTCEIGLSLHSGVSYKSIVYLVDRCTRPGVTP